MSATRLTILAHVTVALVLASMAPATAAGVAEIYQSDDWSVEKHVPVIDCPRAFVPGEMTEVTIQVGKEIAHPNTTEHHIRWVRLYFLPEGSSFVHEIGVFEFNAHGEAVAGPNTGTVYANHKVTVEFRTDVPGTLLATSLCNIHGLWESSKEISVTK
jgi:superoxide reductase